MHWFVGLLGLLGLVSAEPTKSRFERVDRVLAEIPVRGDTLRAVVGVLRDRTSHVWPDSSVESLRIVNRHGTYLYEDTFYVHKGRQGPLYAQVLVEAWPIQSSAGWAFKFRDEAVDTLMRVRFGPRYHCRYLAVRADSVVPITPWCRLCSPMLPGDVVLHSVQLPWFKARVPLKLRFDLARGGIEVPPHP